MGRAFSAETKSYFNIMLRIETGLALARGSGEREYASFVSRFAVLLPVSSMDLLRPSCEH